MTEMIFLTDEAASELLGMSDDQLDRLLETRLQALHSDPTLNLESAFRVRRTHRFCSCHCSW